VTHRASQYDRILYYGVSGPATVGAAFIATLRPLNVNQQTLNHEFSVDAGDPADARHIYWAGPVDMGEPVFRIGGSAFTGGFSKLGEYTVGDFLVQLWRTNQVGLGATSFRVTRA
jgi:hypothetical protein